MRNDALQSGCVTSRDAMCSFRRPRVALVQYAAVSWGAAMGLELPVARLQLVKDMGFTSSAAAAELFEGRRIMCEIVLLFKGHLIIRKVI
jgi:hypothetical protein